MTSDSKSLKTSYSEYINPGLCEVLDLLGLADFIPTRAQGSYLYDEEGKAILDFTGGVGALNLGHNHPDVIAARKKFLEEQRPSFLKMFLSPYQVQLAEVLAELLPGDLRISFFANSGSEAVEGALKLAQHYHRGKRDYCVCARGGFHGKTTGALSVTENGEWRADFKLLPNILEVGFGDAGALEKLIESHPVYAFITEALQGEAVRVSPAGYFQKVREICSRHDVLLIVDEVKMGFGRTGKMFAFEHEGIVPDIVTLAKSLGGGQVPVGAYVTTREIFMKAYGKKEEALLHSSTFGGMGEICVAGVAAIEAIRKYRLVEQAERLGKYLEAKLLELKEKYPRVIRGVRGRGLYWGIELFPPTERLPGGLSKLTSALEEVSVKALTGMIVSTLFREHQVLVYFTAYDPSIIKLAPPLIISEKEIDRVVDSLDQVLGISLGKLGLDFLTRAAANSLTR